MRTGYISPAPGRPGQSDVRADKRVRESSGSPTGPFKAAKTDSETKDDEASEEQEGAGQVKASGDEWKKKVEAAKLVGEATISPNKKGEGLYQ